MKKALFLGALALGTVACDPEIAQDPAVNPADVQVAEFDPSASPAVVPSPNDLAMGVDANGDPIVNAPVNPNTPAAEQEFTRDYLNTLNGFPTTVIATTVVKNLNPETVNASTVKFINLSAAVTGPVTPTIGYREATNQITVIPPQPQGWPKGGKYAVVIVGGDKGVKTKDGKSIIGTATWSLASSTLPLVNCPDNNLASDNCTLATELIPSSKRDPAERLADQLNSAKRLEQMRRGYAPLLDLVSAQNGLDRNDLVLAWTFSIMNQPEMTFDPTNSIIPFPNDLLRVPRTATAPARLNLPVPPGTGTVQDLIKGLNTLDGWSTTAPIISENGPTRGIIEADLKVDPATVALGKQVLFVKLTPGGSQPKVKVCINCASSSKRDGSAADPAPQQLQIIPEIPLDPASQYAVVVLRGVKEQAAEGAKARAVAVPAAQALMKLASPLFVDGKSQISAVPDATAAAVEPARAAMKPLFDALAANGIARKDILLAWAFTTQSTHTVLDSLHKVPASPLPDSPVSLVDQTANIIGAMEALSLEHQHVGRALAGTFLSPFLLDDVNGALNPARPQHLDHIPFLLILPATPAPAGGYKTVVFGHGLGGNRTDALAITNKLNEAGYAVAAIDTVFHGERTSCAGITAASGTGPITTPDMACSTGTCDVTPGSATFGRCVAPDTAIACNPVGGGDATCAAAGQGVCLNTGKCEGGDFRRASAGSPPVVSSWNFLNLTNLFATRDNFRHHVLDISQFTRVLASDGLRGMLNQMSEGNYINATTVDYVGQSLGGFQGTLSASVNERMRRVALNVPGGDLVDTLLTSTNPTFAARREGFLSFLESVGRVSGTPGFDEFIVLARTILDPAAPRNYGWYLENFDKAPEGREAFIQYIQGDEVIPNPVTQGLIASANRTGATRTVQSYMAQIDPLPTSARHAFLLIINAQDPGNAFLRSVRDTAQAQVIQFLNTGTANE
ncbi:hypothetical protein OWM54_24045 [Myxococcus sp. MISCRS1]|uniref:hypothetical protein n=1 Tax=Myxococcus sp. MISCRS1 TaxID=2996786 RepID=UPI00226FA41A|nr:hypothetical protein [Myxococcus sp. MISCRS1]MCY1000215.1 hypothetical protein [Myxococcus sp. MISCRS1]